MCVYIRNACMFYEDGVGHTILPRPEGEVTEACDLAKSPHGFL